MHPVAFIPSPSQGVWHLGFVPIRAYALMIIIGIVVAVWLGERRWAAKGGTPGVVIDVAVWAVPFGLVGGRLYHVVTDYQRYFAEGRDPVDALKIWEGGLGIWGAVLLGGVGALIGCRRHGVSVAALGDAVAPGIALAQAIGRWGNYWNQELYGRPLDTFWALEIDQAHRPRLEDGSLDPRYADIATYHPTFLYESLWCVGVAVLVIWAGKRYKLTHGRTFALYLAGYTAGRFWIEWLRIDDAHHVLGMRLNDWTALLVFLGAVAYIYWARDKTGPENVGAAAGAGSDADAPAGTKAEEPKPEETGPDAEKPENSEKAENAETSEEPEAKEPEAEETSADEAEKPVPSEDPDPEPEPEKEPVAEEEPEPEGEADPGEEPDPPSDENGASADSAAAPQDEPVRDEPAQDDDTARDEPSQDEPSQDATGADKGEPVKDGK
jgi:prolipoprotein diacylglyceryl transferase